MKYCKSTVYAMHGIEFRVEEPKLCGDGRWRSNIYIMDPRPNNQYAHSKKPKTLEMRQVVARSNDAAKEKSQEMINILFDAYSGHILTWMADGQWPTATVDLYWHLRADEIRCKRQWLNSADTYHELWASKLSKRIANIRISDVSNQDMLVALMDEITKHSTKKYYTDTDRMCWVLLDDVLWMMVLDGILSYNPIADLAAKHRHKLSEDALASLRRNSMAITETVSMLAECLEKMKTEPIYAAIALRILTGMTVAELCALNCGDWRAGVYVTWIEITKAYKKVRGKAPELTNVLDSYNAYRCIPCSDVVERLLAMQLTAHGYRSPAAPLFADNCGARITPDALKKAEATLKEKHIIIESPLRSSKRGKHFSGALAWSDTLRGNAAYHYRHNTELTLSETSYILGIRRQTTSSEWYVDWCSEPVLLQLKAKINCWHNMLITTAGNCPNNRKHGLYLSGFAPKGAHIMVNNPGGVSGSLYGGNTL